eukprot:TRINITY_DN3866_c0_g1_i1.p1 TRINITY_DN3866_c0_g1~~TRINITY_DN3866_c0_g1_i1.p1  ORF type:complete len:445 (-),score=70.89 TRINITY_DN3866_c0_g1_i1:59-1324(-)
MMLVLFLKLAAVHASISLRDFASRLYRRCVGSSIIKKPWSIEEISVEFLQQAVFSLSIQKISIQWEKTESTASKGVISFLEDNTMPSPSNQSQNSTSLFAKYTGKKGLVRSLGVLGGYYSSEVLFYKNFPKIELRDIRIPAVYYSEVASKTGEFMIIMENLSENNYMVANEQGLTDIKAIKSVLLSLAALHSRFHSMSQKDIFELLGVRLQTMESCSWIEFPVSMALWKSTVKKYGDILPSYYIDTMSLVMSNIQYINGALSNQPLTLVHGDPYLGNLFFSNVRDVFFDNENSYVETLESQPYFSSEDFVTFVDWQMIQHCNPFWDIAYFLTLSLEPEILRKLQFELLQYYYDYNFILNQNYSFEQCISWYKLCIMRTAVRVLVWVTIGDWRKPDEHLKGILKQLQRIQFSLEFNSCLEFF